MDGRVIERGLEGLFGHRVHGVSDRQLGDVQRVGKRGVFDARGRPQRSLAVSAESEESLCATTRELLFKQFVGESSVRDARHALEGNRGVRANRHESLVDFSIDARDEERSHRVNGRQVMTVGLCLLKSGEVRIDHVSVSLQREDERHVDADSFGQHRGDRAKTLNGRRDFDHDVGSSDAGKQFFRLCNCRFRIERKGRLYLD